MRQLTNKRTVKILALLAIVLLLFALSACNKGADSNQEEQQDTQQEQTGDNNQQQEEEQKICPVAGTIHNMPISHLYGVVRDVEYRTISDVDIYFGEENVWVQKTDENGRFEFFFIDPLRLVAQNKADYLSLDSELFDYRLIIKCTFIRSAESMTYDIECIIVVDNKENNGNNLEKILMHPLENENEKREEIFFDLRIGTPGVKLPQGYLHRGEPVTDTVTQSERDYALAGAKVYINDCEEPAVISDDWGISLDYIVAGTRLRIEYSGFTFGISAREPEEGETRVVEPAQDGHTFTINALPGVGYKIFADTDDLDVLLNNN
jgi:hypothetical protein